MLGASRHGADKMKREKRDSLHGSAVRPVTGINDKIPVPCMLVAFPWKYVPLYRLQSIISFICTEDLVNFAKAD